MEDVYFDITNHSNPHVSWFFVLAMVAGGLLFAARSRYLRGTGWATLCYSLAGWKLLLLLSWALHG